MQVLGAATDMFFTVACSANLYRVIL